MSDTSPVRVVLRPLPTFPRQPLAVPRPAAPSGASGAFGTDGFAPGRRQDRYTLTVDLPSSRIYVLDKRTGAPVDRYLTSPGRSAFPTQGKDLVIDWTKVKGEWNPPKSDWAKDAKVVPGGLNNPMGIFKMSLGAYSEFIHGVPASERKDLGHPASHGCLRMSNENVLQLFQRYAGTGTKVHINRDPKESARLKAAFAAEGRVEHRITDGAELLRDAVAGRAPKPVE